MQEGDVLGHEPMGIVDTGPNVSHIARGDRVVIPFNISCGHCLMRTRPAVSVRQRRSATTAAAPRCSGSRSSTDRSPAAPAGRGVCASAARRYRPIKVPHEHPNNQFVYLSDVLRPPGRRSSTPRPRGGSVVVLGLGPMATRHGSRTRRRPRDRRRPRPRTVAAGPCRGRTPGSCRVDRRKWHVIPGLAAEQQAGAPP